MSYMKRPSSALVSLFFPQPATHQYLWPSKIPVNSSDQKTFRLVSLFILSCPVPPSHLLELAPMDIFPRPPGYVLCAETQPNETTEIATSESHTAPVIVQCQLFLENDHPTEPTVEWTKVTSSLRALPWNTNLQSMSWDDFQHGTLSFLSSSTTHLLPAMELANLAKTISWFGSIYNRPKYGTPKGIRLEGNLDYLAFGSAARAAFPCQIRLHLIMKDPRDDHPNVQYESRMTHIDEEGASIESTELLTQKSAGQSDDAANLSGSEDGTKTQLDIMDRRMSKTQRYNCHTPVTFSGTSANSEIEFVSLPKRLYLPDLKSGIDIPNGESKSKRPRTPMSPPRGDMDEISMDHYLMLAKIPDNDMKTRKRLQDNGITHWSFFRRSDEDDLITLGFPAGVARLLWEGVPRLHEYCDGIESNRLITSPTPTASTRKE
ncbi:hypothetical protein PGT21_021428 [Puccinia graminis f. sp. tritici]|uniref:Uncharacterized protein n=1 Tax=Puccinia graminis f. sp. tritici TaxID=56615 RepID=A0A5B0RHL3_PUCGR|nr:hypothetical protein PGT21_021428 [Puccinia graminis f. sp. tritici]KAA1125421.1 hypothetical protein PGTUg99_009061 [Puccinia graminis f. sp. tritici]